MPRGSGQGVAQVSCHCLSCTLSGLALCGGDKPNLHGLDFRQTISSAHLGAGGGAADQPGRAGGCQGQPRRHAAVRLVEPEVRGWGWRHGCIQGQQLLYMSYMRRELAAS